MSVLCLSFHAGTLYFSHSPNPKVTRILERGVEIEEMKNKGRQEETVCAMGLVLKLNGNTGKTCKFLRKQLINCGMFVVCLGSVILKGG